MRSVTIEERRRRLGIRHHLAVRASTPEAAADGVVGLHATDPASVYLSARARVDGLQHPMLENSLYEDRTLVRMLGMRRTMFVVTRETAAIIDAACSRQHVAGQRRRIATMLEDQEIATDGEAWFDAAMEATLAELNLRGEATAVELREVVPELRASLTFGEGKRWAGTAGLSTRVLFQLALEARIIRGRPRGSWLSSQYRWAPTAHWLGGPLPAWDPAAAQAELARRWLQRFGPGLVEDLKWWTGWSLTATRAALDAIGAEPVDLDGKAGYDLETDDPDDGPDTWVALLPALDPTTMGWRHRDWYLDPTHRGALFDRNGNAGPTVWVDGRIAGGWAQRPDGRVVMELFEDVTPAHADALRAEADRLTEWFDGQVATARFRTPLERRLSQP